MSIRWYRQARAVWCVATLLAACLSSGAMMPVHAQDAPASAVVLPEPLSKDAIKDIVSQLSDKEVRQVLLQRLAEDIPADTAVEKPEPVTALVNALVDTVEATAQNIAKTVWLTPSIFIGEVRLVGGYIASLGWAGAASLFGLVALALAAGAAVEFALNRAIIAWRGPIVLSSDGPMSFPASVAIVGQRLWRELAGTIGFVIAVLLALRVTLDGIDLRVMQSCVVGFILVPRLGAAVLRFLLAPRYPHLRIAHTDDATARYLFRNFLGVIVVLGLAFTLIALNRILGGAPDLDRLAFWLNLAVFAWLGTIFFQAREGFRKIIRGRSAALTPGEEWSAQVYPWFAVIAIAVTWLVSAVLPVMGQSELLRGGRHLISLGVLLVTPMLDTLLRALVAHLAPGMQGEGPVARRAYDAMLRSYTRMSRVLVFGALLLFLARIWSISLVNVTAAGVGAQFAQHLIQAMLISVFGYLAWELTRLVINRRLAKENTTIDAYDDDDSTAAPRNAPITSRLGTILPTVSWALQALIITMTILMALGALGIDVTPLLAGAGIAGIAIGFGAQKLVTDVMSGLFFLADDAFRLNEYIDAGGVQGTVERISLRSLMMRDAKGPMLCIPYSGIDRVINFGRDWGIMKLKFTVPFDTDVEKVRKIFKRIGQEMLQNPLLAPGFIEPFKGQGVAEFNDVGIVVRAKFTHKPGAQFGIRREIFNRVKTEFEAAGIKFARREVHVSVSGSETQDDRTRTIAATAGAQVAQPTPQAQP